jgi:hypothetical protein
VRVRPAGKFISPPVVRGPGQLGRVRCCEYAAPSKQINRDHKASAPKNPNATIEERNNTSPSNDAKRSEVTPDDLRV